MNQGYEVFLVALPWRKAGLSGPRLTIFCLLNRLSRVSLCLWVFSFVGCASHTTAPDQTALTPHSLPTSWVTEESWEQHARETQSSLFQQIHSPQLQRLIEEALASNPDLMETSHRVAALGYGLGQANAAFLPEVTASLSKARSKDLPTGFETTPIKPSNSHEAGLALSWEIDLWGRLRNQRHAATAELVAADWDFKAARHSIANLVTRLWLRLWSLQEQIAIESERVQLFSKLEQVIQDRYESGLGQLQDLSLARLSSSTSRAQLEVLEIELDDVQRQLEITLGRYPAGKLRYMGDAPAIRKPVLNVPSAVLASRPDIRSAFEQIKRQHYLQISATRALLPALSLSGDVIRNATGFKRFDTGTTHWSLIGGLAQNLFVGDLVGGGPISLRKAIAWEKQAAISAYQRVVSQAMYEVEVALVKEKKLLQQQAHLQLAYENAANAFADYQERYASGLVSLLDLISVQQQVLEVEVNLTETRAELLNNRVVLALAVGVSVSKSGVENE